MKVEVRLFDKLFLSEVSVNCRNIVISAYYPSNLRKNINLQNPSELENWLADLNPNSKTVISEAFCVPILKDAKLGDRFQFERLGKKFTKWFLFL